MKLATPCLQRAVWVRPVQGRPDLRAVTLWRREPGERGTTHVTRVVPTTRLHEFLRGLRPVGDSLWVG